MELYNTDKKLLTRLSRGEGEAYEALFDRYYDKVRRFVGSIVGDGAAGEDIAQNVFMKMWLNRVELAGVLSINNYLFTIARNEALDFLRKLSSARRYAEKRRADHIEDVCEMVIANDHDNIGKIVAKCVEDMPLQRRMAYKLSREEHLSNAEIALRMNLSKRTVDRHLSLALGDIRAALGNIVS